MRLNPRAELSHSFATPPRKSDEQTDISVRRHEICPLKSEKENSFFHSNRQGPAVVVWRRAEIGWRKIAMRGASLPRTAPAESDQPHAITADIKSDKELLERFLNHQDELAFETLVRRYGPMVFGVCRRILANGHEAEDAFQATFLVLVRKARSISQPELIGNWLYGVAHRIARKASARSGRMIQYKHPTSLVSDEDPQAEAARRELCTHLDAELQRLPRKYREPLVLCYLVGLSNEEAARRLGWPTGSISYRLARAREMLRERLCGVSSLIPPAFLAVLPVLYAVPAMIAMAHLAKLVARAAMRLNAGESLFEVASPSVRAMAARELRRSSPRGWTNKTLIPIVTLSLILAAIQALSTLLALVGWPAPASAQSSTCQNSTPVNGCASR
jgi:RNA polymerase sigma factor (sigma-70 family)